MRTSMLGIEPPARIWCRATVTSADSARLSWARIVHHVPMACSAVRPSASSIAVQSHVGPRYCGSSRNVW
jgi:hypothetical protein